MAAASFFDVLGFGPESWSQQLLLGTITTIEISVGAFATGLLIGMGVAWVKLNGGPWAVRIANFYSTVCRSVPEILLIILLYFAGQEALSWLFVQLGAEEGVSVSGFAVAIVVLGLVQGAYASEIIRGAILAIPKGQVEAAQAYGMQGFGLFRRIVLPCMVPHAIGGLANLWMVIIKDSALVSVVGSNELLFTAKQAAGATKFYFSFFLAAGALYYVLTLLSNAGIHLIERRIRRWMPQA
jgi:polar amino acid transport system permease protein